MAEFAVNSSWQESTQATPFFLNYGRHPVTPATQGLPSAHVPATADFAERIEAGVARARALMRDAQRRQKRNADAHRSELSFAVGGEVLLSTTNLRLRIPGAQKLMPRFVGPYKVLQQVGPVAYKLELPHALKAIHPVFHVSLLRPYNTAPGRRPPAPIPLLLDEAGQDWYEVEAVLQHRDTNGRRSRRQYLVSWKGFGAEHNEWRDEDDLTEVAVREYWAERGEAPPPAPTPRGRQPCVNATDLRTLQHAVLCALRGS
jgi:hypothetical protein